MFRSPSAADSHASSAPARRAINTGNQRRLGIYTVDRGVAGDEHPDVGGGGS